MNGPNRCSKGRSVPFWHATTLTEHGEWLAANGREAEAMPLFSRARATFESLGATVWLDRSKRSGTLEEPPRPVEGRP